MFYFASFLIGGLGYLAFILSTDPQFVPLSVRIGMGVTFFCLATMLSAAWYVVERFEKQEQERICDVEKRGEANDL